MDCLNKCILIGNLTKDPQVYNGKSPVIVFDVATSERYRAKNGENKEATQYNRVKVFGKNALELASQLHKGSSVFVDGRSVNETYKDSQGNTKYQHYIDAKECRVYPDAARGRTSDDQFQGHPGYDDRPGDSDDDIPF